MGAPMQPGLQPQTIGLHLSLLSVFFLTSAALLVGYGYQGSFLLLNSAHTALGDAVIPHLSNLGDSLILSCLLALVVWRRDPALGVTGILAIALTGILAQLLKRNLFSDWDRPLMVFAQQGIAIHSFPHEQLRHNSFPSGHSTTAIAGFTMLAYHFRFHHKSWQAVTAVLAVVVCYARVYMGVHFLGDVLAGGLLALIGTLVLSHWAYAGLARWMQRRTVTWHQTAWRVVAVLAIGLLLAGLVSRYSHLV